MFRLFLPGGSKGQANLVDGRRADPFGGLEKLSGLLSPIPSSRAGLHSPLKSGFIDIFAGR
jgi:hypothetical protein